MINVHTHIFNQDFVPVRFLPLWLKAIANVIVSKRLLWFFKKTKLTGLYNLLNRYYTFMEISKKGSQEDIFIHLSGFYPTGTHFVTLPMDMAFMKAGKVVKDLKEQLQELKQIKEKYPTKDHPYSILPFVFAHPERPKLLDLIKEYIEVHKFSGIKIYPALGYFPHDPRLEKVYEYAEKNSIPVLTHCTRGGVFYKGKLTKEKRTDPRTGEVYEKKSNATFTDVFSDPDRYEGLLNDFPDLKMCFAHFGGASEWDIFLMNSWNDEAEKSWFSKVSKIVSNSQWNAYTDISYTLHDRKYYGILKAFLESNNRLKKRVLFGTDYYMTEQETSERSFGINLRGFLGEELWNQISVENPKIFLNMK
ncbi:MAG: amidohydrolase family protein [Bacteroidota bacterium]